MAAKEGAAEELVRIKQMQELLFTLFGGSNQSTEDAGAEGTPVVIVGDFNATPESQTCRELRSVGVNKVPPGPWVQPGS